MKPLFVTGIGTDVGKTIACITLVNALRAEYWKPVQAGYSEGTDTELVVRLRHDSSVPAHPETYKLKLAASPHIAARKEGIPIDTKQICRSLPVTSNPLVIEGAGGILVPLNDEEFVADLIEKLNAKVVLVSRNYLGSINHSLLTAAYCREKKLDVAGWIFTDEYGTYEQEIATWSGFPVLGKIPRLRELTRETLWKESLRMKNDLINVLLKAQ